MGLETVLAAIDEEIAKLNEAKRLLTAHTQTESNLRDAVVH